MKLHRFSYLALSALLAAALLAGCSVPLNSAAASGGAAGSENAEGGTTAASVGSALDDGLLRIFSSQSEAVFCGTKLLGEYPEDAQVYLLSDRSGDEQTGYFVVGMSDDSDDFHTRVYDSTGAVVYDCGADQSVVSYSDGWLRLGTGPDFDMEYDAYGSYASQIDYNLKTGEERPLDIESGTSQTVFPVGGLTCTVNESWQDDYTSTTTLTDAAGNVVKTFEGISTYYDSSLPENWIMLYDGNAYNYTSESLYNVKTESLYENVAGACIGHYACVVSSGESIYALIDLNTGETVLNCNEMPYYYFGGCTVSRNPDSTSEFDWYTFRHADGTTEYISNYAVDDFDERGSSTGEINIMYLLTDDTVSAYGADGNLLWSQVIDTVKDDDYGEYITAIAGGSVLIQNSLPHGGYDNAVSYEYRIFNSDGLVWQSTDYRNIDVVNGRYLIGSSSDILYLYSVLSSDGTPLVKGLGSVSIDTTGDAAVLNVRKGFSEGWMDLSGNWLWSRGIWRNANDEGFAYLYDEEFSCIYEE